jgi:tagatose 6-phosphate kinase
VGGSHRVLRREARAGGKGVNVARVLHQTGHATLATGLVGGPSGATIRADLDAAAIRHAFVDLEHGDSRSTVTVVTQDGGEATVFNEAGPRVEGADWTRFVARFTELASSASVVVLAGSLPPGLPETAYADLCAATGAACLVDTSGPQLLAAARAGATVKANHEEVRETTGVTDPQAAAEVLLGLGAAAVVVSSGSDGLLVATGAGGWRARPPEVLHGNPTGAGDAASAALAATHARPWPDRLREAVAWSTAAVASPFAGEVDLTLLERHRPLVRPETLERTDAHLHR